MIVRIDPNCGLVFSSYEECFSHWALSIGDGGIVGMYWDKLTEIEVDDVEKARERMPFILGIQNHLYQRVPIMDAILIDKMEKEKEDMLIWKNNGI